MNTPTPEDTRLLDTLRQAGRDAVERKRRLGQYAVVWRDGRPAFIGPNPPGTIEGYPAPDPTERPFTRVRDAGHEDSDS